MHWTISYLIVFTKAVMILIVIGMFMFIAWTTAKEYIDSERKKQEKKNE